jgi:hypothetical protein
LVLLVVWWAGALVAALRDRAELAATFVVLAAWFACTESVFELQSGVVWLAFGFGIWAQKRKASGKTSLPIP